MLKKNFKRIGTAICALTMALSMGAVSGYAASPDWSHGDCYGSVEYNTRYAWGTTSCYEDHTMVYVSIDVRYVCNDSVYYEGTCYDDYLIAEAEIGGASYEILGIKGYHKVFFDNGSCSGRTQAGMWN